MQKAVGGNWCTPSSSRTDEAGTGCVRVYLRSRAYGKSI